jgi:hypothetical protein
MAEGDSKMFGQYQGSRINPVPEGFLGAYAQVSKNLADTGAAVGKGIGDLITGYQAARAKEDALNEQTKSPVFMEGLNKTLTGIAGKKATIRKALEAAGIDPDYDPDTEDDPSAPQSPSAFENLTPEQRQQIALLRAYEDTERDGVSFLKDPSKFDNKKKLQLIGSVTSVNALFDKEKETATATAEAEAKSKARDVDTKTKQAALFKAAEDARKAALPSSKDAQSAVQSAINWATTANTDAAKSEYATLQNQIALLERLRESGGPEVPKQLYAKEAALAAFLDDEKRPKTAQEKGEYYLTEEQAAERITKLDEEIQAAVKNGGDVTSLTQVRNSLQKNLDEAYGGPVWAGEFMTERQTYDAQVAIQHKYQAALTYFEAMAQTQSREGGQFIPALGAQDKQTLWTMIAKGTNDVYDLETGMHYSVSDNGELIEVPLTEDEIKRLDSGQGRKTEPEKASAQAAAAKLKAAQATALFGGYRVETKSFPKDPSKPDGEKETIRQYVATQWEPVLYVPFFPQWSLSVAGSMSGDGTATNENVRKTREELLVDNTGLNAIARAMQALYARDADGKPIPETDPTAAAKTGGFKLRANWDGDEGQAAKEEYARAVFEIKRTLGKGLGPLGPSDYALINSKVSTPTPWSNINTSSPTFIKDVIQAGFWEDYTRDPSKYFLDLQGLANEKVTRVRRSFEQGIGIKAVDDKGEIVDGNFAVRSAIFQTRGTFDTAYVAHGKVFNIAGIVKNFDTNEKTPVAKEAIGQFESVLLAEAQNDKRLNFLVQQWTAARAMAPNMTKAERTGARKDEWDKYVTDVYAPYWRELITYLGDQGMPNKVINKWKYHLEY